MRIGLYGPIANAAYTLTRALRSAGYDAEYLREPADRYPMSQPLWEEAELMIDPERLPHDLPSDEDWRQLAREHGWEPPTWIVDPARASSGGLGVRRLLRARTLASRRDLHEHVRAHAARIDTMAQYDWLVVSGVALVDAWLSGTPYLYWPNGGDLRIVPFADETRYERFLAEAMRRSIRGAAVCGTHDPTLADLFGEVGVSRVPFLPFLVETDRYAPRPPERRSELGREVVARSAGRPILLLAARQDIRWKGTDKFARAFARAVGEGAELFLAISPWGNDVDSVGALVPADAAYVLPGVPSKPLLVDLYSLADVVVDQFALGVHGSTMLEALAFATPVLISLNASLYRSRWPDWTPPPVLDATTENEILAVLRQVAADELDLDGLGRAGREWVAEAHGVHQAHRFVPAP